MPATQVSPKTAPDAEAPDAPPKAGRFDWADPSVPAGNAPSNIPRWPVAVGLVFWLAWVGFLVLMVVQRLADSST